ncbi:uncharacterized protein LOC114255379 [Monomorium pharaonis]|uniref:uncharacterized protein LOC114255379 n=1 Tax=Monomorium pharaonis TaxID=307658 RepID=UPI00102E1D25|nr:uncharacterized protein LOC114255379 [Monomorium pharaonis]
MLMLTENNEYNVMYEEDKNEVEKRIIGSQTIEFLNPIVMFKLKYEEYGSPNSWENVGLGCLKVLILPSYYKYTMIVYKEAISEEILSSISMPFVCNIEIEGNECIWSGIDLDDELISTTKVVFPSVKEARKMYIILERVSKV